MGFWHRCRKHLWILGTAAGTALILAGCFMDQFSVIWRKAVLICLECIGIG